MHHVLARSLLTACVATGGGLLAQSADQHGLGGTALGACGGHVDPEAIIERAFWVDSIAGQLWAVGPDYRARFEPDAVEFTPALGPRAPATYPVRFTLESVRRGQSALPTAAAGEVTAELHSPQNRVVYERGGGVQERYDVGARGLEQSFLFREPPPGTGDLVVRIRVHTELSAEPGTDLAGLRLRAGDFGGVDVGGVLGIDADGRRVPGRIDFDGSHLELGLPGDFVDGASYPLLLDPPISTFVPVFSGSGGTPTAVGKSDVAYKPDGYANGLAVIVWEKRFSATDSDVKGAVYDGIGNALGSYVAVPFLPTPGVQESAPAVASVNVSTGATIDNVFFVVWQEKNLHAGDWDIAGTWIDAVFPTLNAVGPILSIAATTADEVQPDVGGEETLQDTDAVVVYRDATAGLHAAEVQLGRRSGVLSSFVASRSWLHPNPAAANPVISKSGGSARRFCVVWEEGRGALAHRIIDAELNPLSRYGAVPGPSGMANPDVDGDGTSFLILYETSVLGGDVWAADAFVPSSPASAPGSSHFGPIANDSLVDESDPAVALVSLRSPPMYTVAWVGQSRSDSDIHAVNVLGSRPWSRCGSEFTFGHPAADDLEPVLTSRRSAQIDDDQALIVFRTGIQLFRQRWEAFGGGPVQNVLAGCTSPGATPAVCGVNGPIAAGNRDFKVTLSGADPSTVLAFLMVDPLRGPTLSCGSCTRIDHPIVFFAPVRINSATGKAEADVPIPVSCDPRFIGFTMDVQWILFTGRGAPCSAFPGLQLSNALRLTQDN